VDKIDSVIAGPGIGTSKLAVSPEKNAPETWIFRIAIDRPAGALSTSVKSIDAITTDIEQATGFQLQWVRTIVDGVVEFSTVQPLSSDDATVVRSAVQTLDYVFGGVRALASNMAMKLETTKASMSSSREADGFIVKPRWLSSPAGTPGDAVPSDVLEILQQATGQTIVETRAIAGGMVVLRLAAFVSEPTLSDIESRLVATGLVEWAQPDEIIPHSIVPNDSYYGLQWNLSSPTGGINAPMAWDLTTGSANVVVAVIDTGARFDHPDLAGRLIPGYDLITDQTRSRDSASPNSDATDRGDWAEIGDCGNSIFKPSSWHGSHVAGIIGAASSNGAGITGVNWNVRIQPVRVLGRCGGTISDILNGMYWAAGLPVPGIPTNPTPARILNMSLGSTVPTPQCAPAYQTAINAVNAAGKFIIVAAGNNGQSGSFGEAGFYQPSGCSGVMTVGATDHLGFRALYSDFSTQFVVDLSAPGGDSFYYNDITKAILSTVDAGIRSPQSPTYNYYNGTSQATPHVAGVAALLLAAAPSLTNGQIYWTLVDTTRDFNPTSICYRTSLCGWGILDAHAALLRAATDPANGPTSVSIASSANPSPLGQAFTIRTILSPSTVTGTVTYYLDGNPLQGCTNLVLSQGSTGCTFSNYSASPNGYQLQVLFNGDYTHHWAWSSTLTQVVGSGSGTTTTAVEYYYAAWNYYFETAFPDEIAALDGGAFGGVWHRTGQTFKVWSQPNGSTSPTCRFFSTTFAPKSSHFYTPFPMECAAVKVNPNWQFENIAFYMQLADTNGNCNTGTTPLYRSYNNGMGGAPNHRYTTSVAVFNQMTALGWQFEGNPLTKVFACVPL
jgi:serine protease